MKILVQKLGNKLLVKADILNITYKTYEPRAEIINPVTCMQGVKQIANDVIEVTPRALIQIIERGYAYGKPYSIEAFVNPSIAIPETVKVAPLIIYAYFNKDGNITADFKITPALIKQMEKTHNYDRYGEFVVYKPDETGELIGHIVVREMHMYGENNLTTDVEQMKHLRELKEAYETIMKQPLHFGTLTNIDNYTKQIESYQEDGIDKLKQEIRDAKQEVLDIIDKHQEEILKDLKTNPEIKPYIKQGTDTNLYKIRFDDKDFTGCAFVLVDINTARIRQIADMLGTSTIVNLPKGKHIDVPYNNSSLARKVVNTIVNVVNRYSKYSVTTYFRYD